MWTAAVCVVLLCAASQPIPAAATAEDQVPGSVEHQVTSSMEDHPTALEEIETAAEPAAVQTDVSPLSERERKARAKEMPHFLGDSCQSSSQCSATVSKSTCGPEGRCTCIAGFRRSLGSAKRCELHRLGDPCIINSHCPLSHAECRRGVCTCRSGYSSHGDNECRLRPQAGLGEACKADGDCAPGATCRSNHCACSERTVGRYKYRLFNGASCKEGEFQILHSLDYPEWGSLCAARQPHNQRLAGVMCRSLGFSGGQILLRPANGDRHVIYSYKFSCAGSESHIWGCRSQYSKVFQCPEHMVLHVRCD